MTLYSLKEGSTDKGYMLPDSIVWDLGSSIWAHHISIEVRVIQVVKSPAPERFNDLCPKVLHSRCQSVLISLVIAKAHVLQGASVLYDCAPA